MFNSGDLCIRNVQVWPSRPKCTQEASSGLQKNTHTLAGCLSRGRKRAATRMHSWDYKTIVIF